VWWLPITVLSAKAVPCIPMKTTERLCRQNNVLGDWALCTAEEISHREPITGYISVGEEALYNRRYAPWFIEISRLSRSGAERGRHCTSQCMYALCKVPANRVRFVCGNLPVLSLFNTLVA